MAFSDLAHYINFGNGSSTGHYAVTQWAAGASISAGALRRQLATPTVGNERVFVCVVAGTTGGSEPAWSIGSRGLKTTDNTVTWQEVSGQPAMNGDATNTVPWLTIKNTSVSLGQVIKNGSGTHYFICTTAGTAGNGSEPTWNTTAGNTTADNTITWTCLGAVGSFSGWAAPHARIGNATTNFSGGTVFPPMYVGHSHAETQSTALSIAAFGSFATPGKVICVNTAGSVPPVSADLRTSATVSTTSGSNITLGTTSQFTHYYGITFDCGGSGSASSPTFSLSGSNGGHIFDNCVLKVSATGSTGAIFLTAGGNDNTTELRNTQVSFGNTGQRIYINGGKIKWINTASALQGTVPNTLFDWNGAGDIECRGVDFSAAGAGKTLVNITATVSRRVRFHDCKLNASVTKVASNVPSALDVDFYRSGSSGVNYNINRTRLQGTLDEETTIIRTGGANDGTTGLSWKIITGTSVSFSEPFEAPPIAVWNDTTGSSVTVTVEGIWGGGAVPNNDDIWIEVEYLGSNTSPLASLASSAKADLLASSAALASSSATWGGSTTKFKMTATFTPQQKGWLLVYIKAAKASSTFYVDYKATLS
ncbi:hypothetical protein EN788_22150 [Mesorhizobium sp. M2D.F.Ca.ET.145.01.1.1]|uniref:hypothetical protein n=1 Tax=unclassified Mesorhizobium TaxID=325217 RepID=UPI000FCCB855|nr:MULTISPECIES: hypothetical protein [unclassified Mesorhizobium]TGU44621.1 hypothetical protein EN789_21700 [bacterium M00.F.Ca.ET.146.01.1.1]TGU58449.1 hypothetical protein EN791_021700 [Mesorhizobium sp. M2D.F.Ca.ET.148.01.1.1]TGU64381.1 hypothetical protein EN790_21695 [Mesorhizobium sp. M2D.F.Ca.ET.147.01.1.1]TGW09957.1 hypothetical protein EN788_22150 [Mesorhizobium sp. M2D.F.Ca.ET.145.01.1.1]